MNQMERLRQTILLELVSLNREVQWEQLIETVQKHADKAGLDEEQTDQLQIDLANMLSSIHS